jgi:hypothetical protein
MREREGGRGKRRKGGTTEGIFVNVLVNARKG